MTEIRFKNLPSLLKDMEQKKWIIDSFLFQYKDEKYIVILQRYKDNERKPSKHAVAKVEFIRSTNENESIKGYINFYEVIFKNAYQFCDFFGVEKGKVSRNVFVDFSNIFSNYIPLKKVIEKSEQESHLIGQRAEGNNPNAIYCFDVRRNGKKEDGTLNVRSIENSNKAQMLRPKLYEKYADDTNLSFFFSDNPDDEINDLEIFEIVAKRK